MFDINQKHQLLYEEYQLLLQRQHKNYQQFRQAKLTTPVFEQILDYQQACLNLKLLVPLALIFGMINLASVHQSISYAILLSVCLSLITCIVIALISHWYLKTPWQLILKGFSHLTGIEIVLIISLSSYQLWARLYEPLFSYQLIYINLSFSIVSFYLIKRVQLFINAKKKGII